MANSVYQINKGINASIEFKGLKAQYIWYLGGGILILLMLFAILYFIGLNAFLILALVGILGVVMVMKVYALSKKYGEHGMMKVAARRMVPKQVVCRSRKVFMEKSNKKGLKDGRRKNTLG